MNPKDAKLNGIPISAKNARAVPRLSEPVVTKS